MRLHASLVALAPALVLLVAAPAAVAQAVQVSGKVTLRQADGSAAPVAGTHVDLYRTDIAWRAQVNTGRDGGYVIVGVPFVGTYTVAVSAPGAAPAYVSGVRPSQRATIDVELKSGDGSTLTLAQIQAGAPGAQTNAAPRPAAVPQGNNEVLVRLLQTGNAAFAAKDYDGAIDAYNQGLTLRNEPALLINKSIALRMRGVDRFNKAVQMSGDARAVAQSRAKQDWRDSADSARRARDLVESYKAQVAPADYQRDRANALSAHAEALKLVATKVDDKLAEEAFRTYTALAADTPDPAIRRQRNLEAAKIFYDAGDYDRAILELRKVTGADPANPDAHFYLGMSLFSTGQKPNFQEAANQLALARDRWPDSEPLKADVASVLEYLLNTEKVAPSAPRR